MARRKLSRGRPIHATQRTITSEEIEHLWSLQLKSPATQQWGFANADRGWIERHIGRRVTRSQRDYVNSELRRIYDVQQRLMEQPRPANYYWSNQYGG